MDWSWGVELAVAVAMLVLLLAAGVWVAFALAIAGLVLLVVHSGFGTLFDASWTSIVWNTSKDFVLTAVPMFILMGQVLVESGVVARFYDGLMKLLPRRTVRYGGLLQTNVLACAIFAGVTGSSAADAAAVASAAVRELVRRGYNASIVIGSVAAAGTMGILIPPSVNMIVYGAFTGVPVTRLFIAGVIPGIVLALSFMVFIAARVLLRPSLVPHDEAREEIPWKQRLRGGLDAMPILLIVLGLLVSFYFGVATPTEIAALAAFVAVIFAAIFGRLTVPRLVTALLETARTTSMILFVIFGAKILAYGMANADIPDNIARLVSASQLTPYHFILALVVAYFFLGMIMDGIAMMLLTLPVILPIANVLRVDLIWLAVIIVVMVEVGGITPPVGMNLFVLQGISGEPFEVVTRASLPFLPVILFLLLMVLLFPQIALWLPGFI